VKKAVTTEELVEDMKFEPSNVKKFLERAKSTRRWGDTLLTSHDRTPMLTSGKEFREKFSLR
jgi:hypothetical protein